MSTNKQHTLSGFFPQKNTKISDALSRFLCREREREREREKKCHSCHSFNIDEEFDCVTLADGMICVEIKGEPRLLKIDIDNGNRVDTKMTEPSRREPIAETELSRQGDKRVDKKILKPYTFSTCKVWHGLPGTLEVVYAQVKGLLDWEALAITIKSLSVHSTSRRVIMDQGAWCDEEQTIAWERYIQTEGLSQHVGCQHCNGKEKPIAVITPDKIQQRRKSACFCTNFTSIHHSKVTSMDISFFKQFNPETGKFHRALPYTDEEHPRRARTRTPGASRG